jgi:hypothetical protein
VFTDSDCVWLGCLKVEVTGLLEKEHELFAVWIHPADVFRVVDEVRREEGGDRGFDHGKRSSNADVICVVAENIFRVESGEMTADDTALQGQSVSEMQAGCKTCFSPNRPLECNIARCQVGP